MKFYFLLIYLLLYQLALAQTEINLSTDIYHNEDEIFQSHSGAGPFDSTLAMTVKYPPIKNLRLQISKVIGKELDYFKAWNEDGEAHITVVTPVEYFNVLKTKLSMKEIDAIAERYDIQSSKINVLGIGSSKLNLNGQDEQTFFLIVDSADLRLIRLMIFYEFTRRGGDRTAFDPTWFFPHITIGYTKRDLHEADGVIKNLKYSFDKNFKINMRPGTL